MYRSMLQSFWTETAAGQKPKECRRNYGHAQGSKNVERICEEA